MRLFIFMNIVHCVYCFVEFFDHISSSAAIVLDLFPLRRFSFLFVKNESSNCNRMEFHNYNNSFT